MADTIALTWEQARDARGAITAAMSRIVQEAAENWVADTTRPTELEAALFAPSAPRDPEERLGLHKTDWLVYAALNDHLRLEPHDAGAATREFRFYVLELAHHILNSPAWRDREMSMVQSALACSLEFGGA